MKSLLFVLLGTSFLFSSQHLDLTFIKKLSKENYWRYLLHAKNGVSEIDDSRFFLAPNGQTNNTKELEATVNALLDINSTAYCDFPARREWIISKMPMLKIKSKSCPKLDIYMKNLNGDKITLVFPTTHINSPASMFGHTLLRIDKKEESSLTSIAINYAAYTNESSGMTFALKGLFGFYAGKYATMPYYEKIKEYNALENRDIWEYTLNLTPNEIKRLLYHLYEVKDTYSEYYFFDENCSYNMMWLLQVARPKNAIMGTFNHLVSPLLTVREVSHKKMIEKVVFRHSKLRLIKHLINHRLYDKSSALEFEKENYNEKILEKFTKEQQAIILDVAINRLQYKRSKGELKKGVYLQTFLKLLQKRSRLDIVNSYNVTQPSDPLVGHYLSRFGILSNAKGDMQGKIRLFYHDIYDFDKGFSTGAYINFFEFDFSKKREERLQIDKLDFVSISSFASIDRYFQPLSWAVSGGMKRWKEDTLYGYLALGAGYTYGDDDTFVYGFMKPRVFVGNASYVGIGAELGMVSGYFQNIKWGAKVNQTHYNKGFKVEEVELFSIFRLHKQLNLHIRYEYDSFSSNQILFGFDYYLDL